MIGMSSAERFGYEWNKFNKIIPEYEIQFLKWVYPLKKDDFKDKIILDAGCGTGRNSYWPLLYGAKKVVAFDFDKRIVDVAKKNLSQFENAEAVYQSIYDIAYENEFDIVFSIGVVQFLEKHFSNLVDYKFTKCGESINLIESEELRKHNVSCDWHLERVSPEPVSSEILDISCNR